MTAANRDSHDAFRLSGLFENHQHANYDGK